jgi:transposase-like protein
MKARIAVEAIKGQKTIQEIASHYSVHPNQVTTWKKQAIEGAPALFADRRSQPDTTAEALKAELYQQIGQLQVELLCRSRHRSSNAAFPIMPGTSGTSGEALLSGFQISALSEVSQKGQ